MQIFGKFSTTLRITRRLSCNYNARRYTSLVQITQKSQLLRPIRNYEDGLIQKLYQRSWFGTNINSNHEINAKGRFSLNVEQINTQLVDKINLAPIIGMTPIKVMVIPIQGLLNVKQTNNNSVDSFLTIDKNSDQKTSKDILCWITENPSPMEDLSCSSEIPLNTHCVSIDLHVLPIKNYRKFYKDNYFNNLPKLSGELYTPSYNLKHKIHLPSLMFNKFYSTRISSEKPASSHIVCVAEGGKGCISPGNAQYPFYEPATSKRTNSIHIPTEVKSSHVVCVEQGGKGCVSPGNAQYPSFSPANSDGLPNPTTESLNAPVRKCNPDHDYSIFQQIFNTKETLLKCDAYNEAIKKTAEHKNSLDNKKEKEEKQEKQETPVIATAICSKPKESPTHPDSIDTVIASCGGESVTKCPMYIPKSENIENSTSTTKSAKSGDTCKKNDNCKEICEKRRKQKEEERKNKLMEGCISQNCNKPDNCKKPTKKASSYSSTKTAMYCNNALTQRMFFCNAPFEPTVQFKPRGMHASNKGGKDCKGDDPCQPETCPDRCQEELAKVRYNEELLEKKKKKRKLVGCPAPKGKNKVGVCAHAVPDSKKNDAHKKNYHTITSAIINYSQELHRLIPKFNPKSFITQKYSVPSKNLHLKSVLQTTSKYENSSDFLNEIPISNRKFNTSAFTLKDSKGSPCKSKDKGGKGKGKNGKDGKGKDKKKKKDNPCNQPKKEYVPKCNNTDACAEMKKKSNGKEKDSDKKKDDAKKNEGKNKQEGETNKKDEAKKKSETKNKDEKKKKEDPCKKKDEAKKDDPCKKKDGGKKDDPCKKRDEEKKGDPCKKKDEANKEDPCKKKDEAKKDDPCKKKDEAKKDDPCKKKDEAKKDDPCKKKDEAKKDDPCKKKDEAKKDDPCKKKDEAKKDDPCKKKDGAKKDDPCKKKDEAKKEDPCKKKDDPCKKKDGGKKDDPCKKKDEEKKDDPCKKKDGGKKDDPCKKKDGAKKDDPCKKKDIGKKDDPCKKKDEAKKDDPCKKKDGGKKDDPCKKKDGGKKDDPCKKKDGGKKDDPCNKKDGAKKDDPCKKKDEAKKDDPCKKKDGEKKDDPCKKKDEAKDDPCKKKDDKKKKCGIDTKDSSPNCKKFSSFSSSGLKTCSLKMFPRGYCTVKKPFNVSNCLYKRNFSSFKLLNRTNTSNESTSISKVVTTTKPLSKRILSTFKVNNKCISSYFGFNRRYSSAKSGKGKKSDGAGQARNSACNVLKLVKPRRRKPQPNARPRDRLVTDCFKDSTSECGEKLCRDPKKSACKDFVNSKDKKTTKNNKENENSVLPIPPALPLKPFFLQQTLPSTSPYVPFRHFCRAHQYHFRSVILNNYDTYQGQQKSKRERDECKSKGNNEIIKICRACQIEKFYADIPNFSDYDVLIRTSGVAISGSDIHIYEHGSVNSSGISLGHDATGIVEKTGKCIYGLRRGDHVVMESGLSCGICEFCKRGAYNMCMQLIYNGFLMKYQVHPADLCHKLPDNIDIVEATLTHTLAQGCQAVFKAHVTPTTNVLIMGSSPIALASALCARAIGAKQVVLTCTMHAALESIHNDFEFDYVHSDASVEYGEVLEAIFSAFNDWPDVVINCSINERTMNLAVMTLRPCGICILAECESEGASFNALDVLMKNIRMLPSFRSTNMFPTALHLINSGRAPMSRMIAACFPWSAIEEAFQSAQCESNFGYKKVIVQCMEEDINYIARNS